MKDMADFTMHDEGTLVLFVPISKKARDFNKVAFQNAQQWGGGYAVERRFVEDVIIDLTMNEGFTVEMNGQQLRIERAFKQ
jgi:hypothetical protein